MTAQPHDHDAAERVAAYFQPGGFPDYSLDEGRTWTSEQVRQVVDHQREYLRQGIEPDLREVLRQLDEARTAANAFTVFCRQAGCNDAELGAVLEAYSPAKFSNGVPPWLTRQQPSGDVEDWPPAAGSTRHDNASSTSTNTGQ